MNDAAPHVLRVLLLLAVQDSLGDAGSSESIALAQPWQSQMPFSCDFRCSGVLSARAARRSITAMREPKISFCLTEFALRNLHFAETPGRVHRPGKFWQISDPFLPTAWLGQPRPLTKGSGKTTLPPSTWCPSPASGPGTLSLCRLLRAFFGALTSRKGRVVIPLAMRAAFRPSGGCPAFRMVAGPMGHGSPHLIFGVRSKLPL